MARLQRHGHRLAQGHVQRVAPGEARKQPQRQAAPVHAGLAVMMETQAATCGARGEHDQHDQYNARPAVDANVDAGAPARHAPFPRQDRKSVV